ncbi:MAG: FeoB small GTPase domain-containing protein, partial [Desulfobacterales bacterium]
MAGPKRNSKYKKTTSSDILLVGHPNVGKSALFSRMTGVRTIASNYPGTTVDYTKGRMRYGDQTFTVIDAPGTYSLEPLDEAAKVAVDLIDQAQRIINVVDATHLERHLPLTLALLSQRKPVVVALNMSDEARHRGIEIDVDNLADKLGVPVIFTVGRTGVGVKRLIQATFPLLEHSPVFDPAETRHPAQTRVLCHSKQEGKYDHKHFAEKDVWLQIGAIVSDVQTLHHHHHTFGEMLEDISVHRVWGGIAAAFVLAISFLFVRIIGEFLIGGSIGLFGTRWIVLPFGTELFFNMAWKPFLIKLSALLQDGSFLHQLLIGALINGEIDFDQSFGLLTSGLFIPLGVVLPYIFSFYLVLSILEDSGYLPRLAVFLDNTMHRIGLHGYAIIPTLLGLGCNVPGMMATRILESKRQR